jgi:hypothetical protein
MLRYQNVPDNVVLILFFVSVIKLQSAYIQHMLNYGVDVNA